MANNVLLWFLVASIFTSIFIVGVISFCFSSPLRVCPDQWIVDHSGCGGEGSLPCENEEYFILNGERRELQEFNLDWVNDNCDVVPEQFY